LYDGQPQENDVQPSLDSPAPRWGQERRLAFIDLRLQYDGRINRKALQEFFGISTPQASADLELYKKLVGDNLLYDGSSRAYVAGPRFVPLSGRSAAASYLDELYRLTRGVTAPDETFVGFVPPVGVVATPARAIDAGEVAILVRAIRDKTALAVTYQSMNSPKPANRVITPHAMGFDGLRWHVRCWCHTRHTFRDFAIGRVKVLGAVEDAEPIDPSADEGWNTLVNIILVPHPKLTVSQRSAVVQDFGMTNGRLALACRKAMLFYTLRHLNLHTREVLEHSATQHVIVENREEVEGWMKEDRTLLPSS
jgi:hypothetical protein